MYTRRIVLASFASLGILAISGPAWAATTPSSKAQDALAQAAAQNKFTFVVFYSRNDAATQSVATTLNAAVAARQDRAAAAYVLVSDPAERALVEKLGAARAPMPLTVAVAPNGAVTGVFQQEMSAAYVDEAMVTPAMTRCMKAMQENKLVVLCAQPTGTTRTFSAVAGFQADPQFKDRVVAVSLQTSDPAEGRFLKELELAANGPATMVFMAPPGVLVGKYSALATTAQMAADLHKAGKCCNDPNCKHNQQGR